MYQTIPQKWVLLNPKFYFPDIVNEKMNYQSIVIQSKRAAGVVRYQNRLPNSLMCPILFFKVELKKLI